LKLLRFLTDLTGMGRLRAAKEEAESTIAAAEEQKRQMLLEAREEALTIRSGADVELKERRKELQRQEKRHSQREENLERKSQALERQEKALATTQQGLDATREELNTLKAQQLKQLEDTARLTFQEAKELLLKKAEDEAKGKGQGKV